MKKKLLSVIAASSVFAAFAQLPVSQLPTKKKVVLEEFTGITCQYCPDGHKIANQIKASKAPGEVILINIHTGGYATPGPGKPVDYTTPEGDLIANMPGMNITGYPTGSM